MHSSRRIITCFLFPLHLAPSLIQSLTIKWKGNPGVSEADWQHRQRWKDEKSEGAADEGTREGMRGEKNKNPRNHKAQPALTVNGLRNVLEAWLVSVRALWEGEWRSTVVEPLVHSGGKLQLQASPLKVWRSHWNIKSRQTPAGSITICHCLERNRGAFNKTKWP